MQRVGQLSTDWSADQPQTNKAVSQRACSLLHGVVPRSIGQLSTSECTGKSNLLQNGRHRVTNDEHDIDDVEFIELPNAGSHPLDPYDVTTPQGDASPVEETDDQQPYRPAPPGLPESLGWLVLFFALNIGLSIVMIGVAVALSIEHPDELQNADISELLSRLDPSMQLFCVASPALFGYFILVPLGLWRMSPQPIRKLNFSLPTISQLLVMASLLVPLTLVADWIMTTVNPVWLKLTELVPALQGLNGMDVHELLKQFGAASLPLAIFLIAAVPGFGEEFLFRGLIGRGLVSRWGWTAGILMTSFLFAAVHLYPPHVLAILPVGIALHWIYLTTKSFWAPVLFHFANNTLATLSMRSTQPETHFHWGVTIIALAYTVWCLYWLWRMRTVHESEDGPVLSPGHEVGAPATLNTRRHAATHWLPIAAAFVMIVLEAILLFLDFSSGA